MTGTPFSGQYWAATMPRKMRERTLPIPALQTVQSLHRADSSFYAASRPPDTANTRDDS